MRPGIRNTLVIGHLRGCTRDQLDDKCRELGLPLTGTKQEKEIRISARLLTGSSLRRTRIFETPAVREVAADHHGLFGLVGRAWSKTPHEVRKAVAGSVNGSDRDYGTARKRETWLPVGCLGKSLTAMEESLMSRENTGDEIVHRRAQKLAGVKIVVMVSDFSRVYKSDFGGPHDRGVCFVTYNPSTTKWGYLEIHGRFLQGPEHITDPDVVRVWVATEL